MCAQKYDPQKAEEYLKKYNEIVDFIIGRKVVNAWLLKFSIVAVIVGLITLFGLYNFTDQIIKDKINVTLANKINKEINYLEKVNEISKLGALATSTGDIKFYRELESILEKDTNEDIKSSVKAGIMRIQVIYLFWNENLITDFSWKEYTGRDIPTNGLVELFNKETDLAKRLSLIDLLGYRNDKDTPDQLLNIAKKAKHIKELQSALNEFRRNVNSRDISIYNVKEVVEWWQKEENKEKWRSKHK
jgi:hypothetical protein